MNSTTGIDGAPADHVNQNLVTRSTSVTPAAVAMLSEEAQEQRTSTKISEAEWTRRCKALQLEIAKRRRSAKGPLLLAQKVEILRSVKQLEADLDTLLLNYFEMVE